MTDAAILHKVSGCDAVCARWPAMLRIDIDVGAGSVAAPLSRPARMITSATVERIVQKIYTLGQTLIWKLGRTGAPGTETDLVENLRGAVIPTRATIFGV